jgi:hypothetical protein
VVCLAVRGDRGIFLFLCHGAMIHDGGRMMQDDSQRPYRIERGKQGG